MATIEIDGKTIEADSGTMIIEVADAHDIHIPRFCYHKKLSVAANCRMCLVEVEKSRKALPACATPITDGMKVFTQSKLARDAQQAVMEFLLINHPLDCPICDQGGECELQDVSMGFGADSSHYSEGKRSVNSDDLGPLIETEMTRCIHCTRCVRFGEEIAGLRELGGTGRGEDMQIGTYLKHSIVSEVSGNVIDLCPVGALTSKPFRYTARAWELQQADSIAPHDALGSNLHVHSRRGQVMRVVPKENELINETWISDRDRYSYTALQSDQRVTEPMIKQNNQWQAVDWATALKYSVESLLKVKQAAGTEQIAAFASPSSTTEELYLLQKLMRAFGVHHLDHRVRESDVSDQAARPISPALYNVAFSELDNQQAILLVGTNLQRELPLAGLRVRKMVDNGGQVLVINSIDAPFNFAVKHSLITSPSAMPDALAQVVKALQKLMNFSLDETTTTWLSNVKVDDQATVIAEQLILAKPATIVLGLLALHHPHAAQLRHLADLIAQMTDARVMQITDGANSAGAWIAGMIPHRLAGGRNAEFQGLVSQEALKEQLKAYVLFGLEPDLDFRDSALTMSAMQQADFVLSITSFTSPALEKVASVILPMAAFTETSGTFVNLVGEWQSFTGIAAPPGEARPGWKILRVLGNLMQIPGFDYLSSESVLEECLEIRNKSKCHPIPFDVSMRPLTKESHLQRLGSWPIYRMDGLVRRSQPLQLSATSEAATVRVNAKTAEKYGLSSDKLAVVTQNDVSITLPLVVCDRLADDTVYVPSGFIETAGLGDAYGPITVRSA